MALVSSPRRTGSFRSIDSALKSAQLPVGKGARGAGAAGARTAAWPPGPGCGRAGPSAPAIPARRGSGRVRQVCSAAARHRGTYTRSSRPFPPWRRPPANVGSDQLHQSPHLRVGNHLTSRVYARGSRPPSRAIRRQAGPTGRRRSGGRRWPAGDPHWNPEGQRFAPTVVPALTQDSGLSWFATPSTQMTFTSCTSPV